MVNKLTIETAYKQDPYKSYYAIINPQIDTKAKKVSGLKIKHVEYKVKDWDQKVIRFEKVNIMKDKKFPTIIEFDKRFPDAENEVHVERASKKEKVSDDKESAKKTKKKKVKYDSFGIFIDEDMAHYNKLVRLHRLATDMSGIYKALKARKEKVENPTSECEDGSCGTKGVKPTDSGADSKGNVVDKEAAKDIKKGVDVDKVDLSIEDVKSYFDAIQETEYFEQLETIQANDPSLATR